MANILLVETATEVCSVALATAGEVVTLEEDTEGGRHSALLTVFVERVLATAGMRPEDLDAVCVSRGPGSYTGLRIGVSAAKGLCYALGIPLLAISTLDALAAHAAKLLDIGEIPEHSAPEDPFKVPHLLCPMLDARRMEVYTALYDRHGHRLTDITARIIGKDSFTAELSSGAVVFFGNGAPKCREILTGPNAWFPGHLQASARFMSQLAQERYEKQEFENVPYFEPFYLKDFIATVPRNKVF